MMVKQKKYILAIIFSIIGGLAILSNTIIWNSYLESFIDKKIQPLGWNIQVGSFSGNFLSTFKMNQIELKNKNGPIVNINKVSVNIDFFSSLFDTKVLDLFIIEGMNCKYF